MACNRLAGWSCKLILLALLVLAGGKAYGQSSMSNPGGTNIGCTPTGSPASGNLIFGITGSTCGWRAMTSSDVNQALTPCNFTAGAITGCTSAAFSGSNAFINFPSNTSHSFSSGDLVNNAGFLQFNNGSSTNNLIYNSYVGGVTIGGGILSQAASGQSFFQANGLTNTFPGVYTKITTDTQSRVGFQLDGANVGGIFLGPGGSTFPDLWLNRSGSGALTIGNSDGATNGTATAASFFGNTSIGLTTVMATLQMKAGSNARTGTGTLSGGTLVVSNTSITANSQVFVQDTGGGTLANIGSLYIASQTAGTGFTVTSTNALDNSTFRYWIYETN